MRFLRRHHTLMKAKYTTLSSEGQIIIPVEIREQMNLSVGTKFSIQRDGQTLILQPVWLNQRFG